MKDSDILCELYADTHSVADDCEAEVLDSDSNVPTTPSHKQFQSLSSY
jgi:hypothetical protein